MSADAATFASQCLLLLLLLSSLLIMIGGMRRATDLEAMLQVLDKIQLLLDLNL